MLRVTADSNIYISAMNFGGAPDKLLEMARNGDIVLAISDPIVEEVTHVLRDKFGWTDEAIKLAQARIADFTEKVHPRREIDVVKENPSDNRILECATENGIIRGKGTSFCFPHHADRSNAAAGELCNAKNDSVAYCDTTRPEQHEYWLGLIILTERLRQRGFGARRPAVICGRRAPDTC